MPNYTYSRDFPAGDRTPAEQRTTLTTNTNSVDSLVNVDLYGFNNNNGGLHQQVTLPANNTPGAQTGLSSVVYSGPGTADPASSQLFYRNSLAIFPLSLFKAFGLITGTALTNSYNITSVTNGILGQYDVTMSVMLPGSAFAVIALPGVLSGGGNPNVTISFRITGPNSFILYTQDTSANTPINVSNFTFVVLQV